MGKPLYYKPAAILRNGWRGRTVTINRAFAHMEAKAAEWDAPLFLGDFGVSGSASRAGDYVSCLQDRLDDLLASGAQWNYTPNWNDRDKDGWNAEDFNILDRRGLPRPNFSERPYPRAVAGVPGRFEFRKAAYPGQGHAMEFTWEHRPERGVTEIFVPGRLFPQGSTLTIEGEGATCWRDEARQLLICLAPRAGTIRVRMTAR